MKDLLVPERSYSDTHDTHSVSCLLPRINPRIQLHSHGCDFRPQIPNKDDLSAQLGPHSQASNHQLLDKKD